VKELSFSGTEEYEKGLRESVLLSFGGTKIGEPPVTNLSIKLLIIESFFIKEGDEPEGTEEPESFEKQHRDGDSKI
jgi:hypothetical protein